MARAAISFIRIGGLIWRAGPEHTVGRVRELSPVSISMNLRHVAALTLIGWYLMLAPFRSGIPHDPYALRAARSASEVFDFDAPLPAWTKQASLDSGADCQSEKDKLYNLKLGEFKQAISRRKRSLARELTRFQHARCVKSDDPLLKAK